MTRTKTQPPPAKKRATGTTEPYPLHMLLLTQEAYASIFADLDLPRETQLEDAACARPLDALESLVRDVLADTRIEQAFRTSWQTLWQLIEQVRPAWEAGMAACRARLEAAGAGDPGSPAQPGHEAVLLEAVERAEAACGTFNQRYWYVAGWMAVHGGRDV